MKQVEEFPARSRCQGTKKDGSPCPATAPPGKLFCAFHDPGLAEQRAAGRRQGGRVRSKAAAVLPPTAPDLPLKRVEDVVALLGESINLTRRGQLDPKVSNALGYLSSVLLKELQDSDLAAQLAELRKDLEALKQREQQQRELHNGQCQHTPRG
jgi:hypothetical protein